MQLVTGQKISKIERRVVFDLEDSYIPNVQSGDHLALAASWEYRYIYIQIYDKCMYRNFTGNHEGRQCHL